MSDVLCGKVWFGAFEDGNEVVCVANFDMPVKKVPVTTNDWVSEGEKIYRATQNIMDSWSLTLEQINNESKDFGRPLDKKEDGADWSLLRTSIVTMVIVVCLAVMWFSSDAMIKKRLTGRLRVLDLLS